MRENIKVETALVTTSELYPVELNNNLNEEEIELAEKIIGWLTIAGHFYGIAGHMIVTGMPRQGKGLFATWLSYWLHRLFRNRHIICDEKMKPAFGEHKIFNEDMLRQDIDRMMEVAKDNGAKLKKTEKESKDFVEKWIAESGEVVLKNSILRLTEYWRYMYNRRPGTLMNYFISGILRQWGHIDTFVIGDAQLAHDLDAFTCLPYVNYDVRCMWSSTRQNTVDAHFYQTMFNKSRGKLTPIGKPHILHIDGGKQHEFLGVKGIAEDGSPIYNSYFDLYYSKSPPQLKFSSKKLMSSKSEEE
jgi:hypothetical protein